MQGEDVASTIVIVVFLSCAAVAWLSSMWGSVIWWKLGRYLEEHNPDRLKELTGVPYMGFNTRLDMFGYFFNNVDNDDPIVHNYKHRIRRSIRLALVAGGLLLTEMVIVILVCSIWGSRAI